MTLRRLWRWHDEPALIAAAATGWGRAALWAAAVLLLPDSHRLSVGLVLALTLVWPERRIDLLALAAIGTLWSAVPAPTGPGGLALRVAPTLVVLGILFLFWEAARRFKQLPMPVRRYPIAAVHVTLMGGVALSVAARHYFRAPAESALGVLFAAIEWLLPFVLWRVSYVILAGRRGTAARHRFRDHLFYLIPLWGGTKTPYGKGHGYLAERYVEDPRELAAVRLAGIKLLALAWIWTGVDILIGAGVNGDPGQGLAWLASHGLGLAKLGDTVTAGPAAYTLLERWAAVVVYLVRSVLGIATSGHVIIGALRLFGFRVFRNTYRPLVAPTVVEFWNRYYFYFKELLVEFFFYPTYVATSRFGTRARMFLAVMAAACVGNLYYHVVIRDFYKYFMVPPNVMWDRLAGRVTYSVILGIAIFVSMRREQSRRGKAAVTGAAGMLHHLRGIAGVWLLYGFLQVWLVGFTEVTFAQRARYTLGLVGITVAGGDAGEGRPTSPSSRPAAD